MLLPDLKQPAENRRNSGYDSYDMNRGHRASLRHFREAVLQYQDCLIKFLKNGILMPTKLLTGGGALRGDKEVERVVKIAQSHPLFKLS